jgi:hypothetical protein
MSNEAAKTPRVKSADEESENAICFGQCVCVRRLAPCLVQTVDYDRDESGLHYVDAPHSDCARRTPLHRSVSACHRLFVVNCQCLS